MWDKIRMIAFRVGILMLITFVYLLMEGNRDPVYYFVTVTLSICFFIVSFSLDDEGNDKKGITLKVAGVIAFIVTLF